MQIYCLCRIILRLSLGQIMYIVAIAWIYVVLMVSVMQTTFFRGVMTFIFTGILPLALLLFLIGTPQRRRNQAARSDSESKTTEPQTLENKTSDAKLD